MLRNTFLHIPRIGRIREQKIWSSRIFTWDDYWRAVKPPLSGEVHDLVLGYIILSERKRRRGEICFFYERLNACDHWRLFGEFYHQAAYLDIETTGLGDPGDYITTIALYSGGKVKHYVRGMNLSDFPHEIKKHNFLLTYNGKSFDIPFIEREFGISLKQPHIDLRYLLGSLGYSGGLKGCERKLGISREMLEDVDGYFAVLLWYEYKKKGNKKALETLLAYNIQDTLNLEKLMYICYNQKLAGTPFKQQLSFKEPELDLPFKADRDTINSIRRALQGSQFY